MKTFENLKENIGKVVNVYSDNYNTKGFLVYDGVENGVELIRVNQITVDKNWNCDEIKIVLTGEEDLSKIDKTLYENNN